MEPDAEALRARLAELAAVGGVLESLTVEGHSEMPTVELVETRGEEHEPQPVGERELLGATAPIYRWERLDPGAVLTGPALLESETNSCTVPDGWQARLDPYGNALLERSGKGA
jgi:N-methylhydantoinase A/oxoprolinase/acetone carboxylase beta subunit